MTVPSFLTSCEPVDVELESAYRFTFANDMGYTLIGVKPISHECFVDYYLRINRHVLEKFIRSLRETFKDSERFVFKVFDHGENDYEVELIHRVALRQSVLKSNVLKEYIAKHFRSESAFYSYIEDKNVTIFELEP